MCTTTVGQRLNRQIEQTKSFKGEFVSNKIVYQAHLYRCSNNVILTKREISPIS